MNDPHAYGQSWKDRRDGRDPALAERMETVLYAPMDPPIHVHPVIHIVSWIIIIAILLLFWGGVLWLGWYKGGL